MCVVCYLGINSEIAERNSNINISGLGIKKVDKSLFDDETFSNDNIYEIVTRYGCGCGFSICDIPCEIVLDILQLVNAKKEISEKYKQYFTYNLTIEEIKDTVKAYQESAEDLQKLYSLIFELCETGEKVEFFGCWAEDEKEKPDKVIYSSPENLKLEFDGLSQRRLKIVVTT